jgi:hypothetical protein
VKIDREGVTMLKFTENSSRTADKKDERARQTDRAMQEYNARKAAIAAKTEKLRSLRLAREAETGDVATARTRRTKKQPAIGA